MKEIINLKFWISILLHEYSLEFVHCPKCSSKLECDTLEHNTEIEEGFLNCYKCNLVCPIVKKIPIIWNDFENYVSDRPSVGGELMRHCKYNKTRNFIKNSLSKIKVTNDRNIIEKRWTQIYQNNKKSKFYSTIKKNISFIPSKFALEYGCSIGIMSNFLAESVDAVFGVDRSFLAICIAKKSASKNADYFVADSLDNIFGKTKFDLVLALNILELVEPTKFLRHVSSQIKNGYVVLTDPYDYERGIHSVKIPLDAKTLRKYLNKLGFRVTTSTRKPCFIPWTLKLNPRASLNYKVDLVIAKN